MSSRELALLMLESGPHPTAAMLCTATLKSKSWQLLDVLHSIQEAHVYNLMKLREGHAGDADTRYAAAQANAEGGPGMVRGTVLLNCAGGMNTKVTIEDVTGQLGMHYEVGVS